MKLYLWDQAAKDFTRNSDPMKSHPHRFFGHNCEPKNSSRLSSNLEIAKRVNTNEETMAIRQIFAYIKQEYAKIKKLLLTTQSFDCIATIDDIERDSAWYYIAAAVDVRQVWQY